MYRTCKCGGIIRENMKPYWDTLPSCSCQNPIMVETPSQTYKAAQAEFDENHDWVKPS